jgi:hypothetical protein
MTTTTTTAAAAAAAGIKADRHVASSSVIYTICICIYLFI